MINKFLLKEFKASMRKLNKDLTPDQFLQVVKNKLIDYVDRNPNANTLDVRRAVEVIFKPEAAKWMREVSSGYNTAIDIVNDVYSDLAGDLRRDLPKLKRVEKINDLRLGKYADETISHIQKTLVRTYREGLSFKETVELIGKEDDRARFYAKTIATTQMNGYSRLCKNEKANIAEVFYYEYVGPIRIMSRDFCKDMLGKTLHINDINKISALEVGSPFISPCIIYCGGWNCGHDWEPDPFYEFQND